MNMGEKLSELREDRGLTQRELAEQLHVSNSSISAFETGAREPNVGALRALASAFNVTMDYLAGLTEDPMPPAVLAREFTKGVRMSAVVKMLETLSPAQRDALLVVIDNMSVYTEVKEKTAANGAK